MEELATHTRGSRQCLRRVPSINALLRKNVRVDFGSWCDGDTPNIRVVLFLLTTPFTFTAAVSSHAYTLSASVLHTTLTSHHS